MRDACGSNQTCLKNAYQSRIAELELPRPSPESGSYRQPPWCREQSSYNAAEQEICGSPPFWALDAELNRVYVAARQKTGVKALAASEMRWKKARDACGSNQACLKDAYQKRIQVLRQL
jgi:uncharacterized protein